MANPDRYWLERLKKDRALAERAAHEVEEEVRRAYRSQYLQVARKLDLLYAEANRTGTLSRTKLWNYKRWRELEADLVKYCEAGHVIQRDAITKALDSVFEDVIGTGVEVFQREKYILPYTPRAVIDTAWSGEHYSERIWKNQQALAARLREDAQQILMGDKSPAEVKRMLQKDYDVSWGNASRLVDTELSYVVNRANAENYRRMGVQKVTIVNLDVNTCEKCKALEGEVFALEDAPVLPIHPRCHCSYCAPRDGDAAEITASGNDLEEVYARKGVKGYGETPKQYAPKGTSPSRLQAKVDEAAKAFGKPEVEPEKANAQAPAAVSAPEPVRQPETEAAKTPENTAVSLLQKAAESGIIETESWYERTVAGKPEMEAKYQAMLTVAKTAGRLSGKLSAPHIPDSIDDYDFDDNHINADRNHNVTEAEAKEYIRNALVMEERNGGAYVNYYGVSGSVYILARRKRIRTAFKAAQYTPNIKRMMEVITNELGSE